MINGSIIPRLKKKVLIVQPLLAHYRNSLFQRLANSKDFEIKVIAGNQINNIREIIPASSNIVAQLVNRRIKIAGHMFIWQAGVTKLTLKFKPDLIVLTGVDPHIISNLYLSLICKLFLKTKIIWWGHADLDKKGSLGKQFRLFFFNISSGILTYNERGKENIKTLAKKNIQVTAIKNCINDNEYGFNQSNLNPSTNNGSRIIRILFSGRLTKPKRLDILIEALSVLQKKEIAFHCWIIGDGNERKSVEQGISFYKLGNSVELLGERYENECIRYFHQSDLFVLPGKVGLSIIHGLSYGLPVITSDNLLLHSPEHEIIRRGYNGDFFSGLDPNDLAEKLIFWGGLMKTEKGCKIRHQCISSIIEGGYTPQSMNQKMTQFFKSLTDPKN